MPKSKAKSSSKRKASSKFGTCEMLVFCSVEESPSQERECGDIAVAECTQCGSPFCVENEHGDEIMELCRDCNDGDETGEFDIA